MKYHLIYDSRRNKGENIADAAISAIEAGCDSLLFNDIVYELHIVRRPTMEVKELTEKERDEVESRFKRD